MSLISYHRGQGSIILRVKILDSTVSTGAGKTGLTNASSGLIISTVADNESAATAYTQAASHIQTIATLGTYAAPSASNCRFGEVDSTNHKGVYEIQIADARYAVSSAKSLLVSVSGATGAADCDAVIPLTDMDPYDAVRGGMSALPNTPCTTNASLLTSGTSTDQLSVTSGVAKANLAQILGTALTETAGFLAAGFKKFFNIATPASTMDHLTLLDTVTTYTGNTPQTGDGFARLGAPAGASVSADVAAVKTDTGNLATRLTAVRAGYLDNLNVGGVVASHADITAINQSASKHMTLATVGQYAPGETYTIEMRTYQASDGSAVNADTTPTLTATGNVSGSLAANLSAATNPATGVYRWTYTPGATPTLEQIRLDGSATIASVTFTLSAYTQIVDEPTATFTSTDKSNLTAIFNKLPATNIADQATIDNDFTGLNSTMSVPLNTILTNLDAKVSSRSTYAGGAVASVTGNVGGDIDGKVIGGGSSTITGTGAQATLAASQPNYAPAKAGDKMDLVDAPNGVAVTAIQSGLATATNLAAVKTDTGNLVSRVGAWTGSGNNTMLGGMRALANKLAGLTPTDLTSGGGTFDNTEDSLEAAHDSGAVVTVGGYAVGQDPATLVLDPAASGHNTAGTIGNKINAAGASGDPLANDVPGNYAAGTAGYKIGHSADTVEIIQRNEVIEQT